jgi:hypothetical protein
MAHDDDDALQTHEVERELFDGPGQTQPSAITSAEAMTVALFGVDAEGPPPRRASRRSFTVSSERQLNRLHPVFSREPSE